MTLVCFQHIMKGNLLLLKDLLELLKKKIYRHMAAIFKNVYFDVLDYIVDKYKNTYHNTIKMKPIDVKNNNFTKYNEESNEKDPKFKIGNRVRIVKK